MATLYDLFELGDYIAKHTKVNTELLTSKGRVSNDLFTFVVLSGSHIGIRHKNDHSQKANRYKTLNGAIRYVDKWLSKEGAINE